MGAFELIAVALHLVGHGCTVRQSPFCAVLCCAVLYCTELCVCIVL